MKHSFVLTLSVLVGACAPPTPSRVPAPAPKSTPKAACTMDAPCTLFRDVKLFDGDRVVDRTSVLVRGAQNRRGLATPRSAEPGDRGGGAGRTLLPGLIDSHVHVWEEAHLVEALRFGVTTELDMMTNAQVAARLRSDATRRNNLADLRSAGTPVTARGGHGTEYRIVVPTLDRAENAGGFVTERVKEGSDYLKIIYTPDSPVFRSIDRDILRASVVAAHERQRMAVVHVDTLRGATDALAAGADGLAHLFYDTAATPELVEAARARGAFVVPTLSVLRTVIGKSQGPELAADADLGPKLSADGRRTLTEKIDFHPRSDEAGINASVRTLHAAGSRCSPELTRRIRGRRTA